MTRSSTLRIAGALQAGANAPTRSTVASEAGRNRRYIPLNESACGRRASKFAQGVLLRPPEIDIASRVRRTMLRPVRSVAQPGRALALGARRRRFESCRSDHFLLS